ATSSSAYAANTAAIQRRSHSATRSGSTMCRVRRSGCRLPASPPPRRPSARARRARRSVSAEHGCAKATRSWPVCAINRLEEIFLSVCTDFEAVLKEFNGEPDHVHLLVNYPPKVRLSELVNSLKGVSSRRMKQEFPAISTFRRVRKSKGHLWSPSYFVGSVGGAPITILRQYIEGQNRPSAGAL